MKISKINELFRKLGALQVKFRWAFITGLLVITAFCCAGITRLKVGTNETEYFENWEQIRIDADHFREVFGSPDGIGVLVEATGAEDVFDPEVLDAIDRLGKRMEQEIPYAKDITSIMDLSVTEGTEDGFNVINPFEDGVPADKAEIEAKKAVIMSKANLVNTLISDDAKSTWVMLKLEDYGESVDEAKVQIAPPANKIFTSDEFVSDKYTIKPCGLTYTEWEEDQCLDTEIVVRLGIGFLLMIIFLILFIRSLRGVLVPFFATIFAILSSLGVAGWIGAKMDTQLIMLPVLLSMALAVGYAVHYINSFRLFFRRTQNRKQAVELSVGDSGWPILFTAITTMAGMISFSFSGLVPLRRIGILSAGCVFAVYAYIMIFIPTLMTFGKNNAPAVSGKSEDEKKAGATKTDLYFEKAGTKVLGGRKAVIIFTAVILAAMIPGIMKNHVNMDMIDMMGTKIPYIKRMLEISQNKIGNMYDYNVFIESEDEDFFKQPENMKKLDQLQADLGKLPLTKISGTKPRVSCISETVKEINKTLNSEDDAFYVVPDNGDLISQELLFYETTGGDDLYNQITEDFSTTFLQVQLIKYDASLMTDVIAKARKLAEEAFPGTRVAIVGEVANFAEMNGKLVWGELKSFGVSFLIIMILMMIAFGSVTTGLIGMIPNIAPVILIGGVMGFVHIPLDMITMMIMPMILGIAVDDTIHFNNHVKYHFELCGSYRESILATFREIGKTMGMTTVILCSMFAVLAFSSMPCFARIGYLSVIGLAGALLADYTITPVVIFICKPFGKENK